jgi:hypothetical protein
LIVGHKGLSEVSFENVAFELGGDTTGAWADSSGPPGSPAGTNEALSGPNTVQGFVGFQAGFHDRNFSIGNVNTRKCKTWNATRSPPSHGSKYPDCWPLLAGIPAAVQFVAARSVRFTRCSFMRLGSGGLLFSEGSRDNVVEACHFRDISGSAVTFGGIQDGDQADASQHTRNNVLRGSLVERTGVEYAGTAAITVGWAQDTVIEHCLIREVPYSGISLGWGWGQESYMKNNSVRFTEVDRAMCGRMVDGGAVYTLGPQLGSSLHNNWLHGQCNGFGLLYHDSGSQGFDDHNNVLSDSTFPNVRWLLVNGGGQNCRSHQNFVDATCNMTYAACMGKSAGPARVGNGSCSVWGIDFVASSAQFPPQAWAIMKAAGLDAAARVGAR